jgi:hypothetical protein
MPSSPFRDIHGCTIFKLNLRKSAIQYQGKAITQNRPRFSFYSRPAVGRAVTDDIITKLKY